MRFKDLPLEEYFSSGHTGCQGCGGAIVARLVGKILGEKTMVYVPASCLIVFGATYPLTSWKIPQLHVAFENTGAVISGMKAGLRILGKKDINVVGIAGVGGTADIGLQALSGAAERNEDVIYICYDNEAYMNTGTQRSGATPYKASTTTTLHLGKSEHKKDVPTIVAAHNVPYVATASVGYPQDLINKIEKMKTIKGFRYLHVLSPCPPGWKVPSEQTVQIGKLAVDTGMWILYEIENGVERITKKVIKRVPVKEYLKLQGRFKHLDESQIAHIQEMIEAKWAGIDINKP